jgi:circadian clock protein KaiB
MSLLRLRLYVAGDSPGSRRARENLARLQRHVLPPCTEIRVVDVLKEPRLAEEARILATPTLSLEDPLHRRRIVGDLSDLQKVLSFLGFDGDGQS